MVAGIIQNSLFGRSGIINSPFTTIFKSIRFLFAFEFHEIFKTALQ